MKWYNTNRYNKPLLGALSVVGKDTHGRKIILPTYQAKEKISKIRKISRYLYDKLLTRKRISKSWYKMTAEGANLITREYMRKVRITLNQYKWKQGVFIKEIHPEAFN